MDLDKIIKCNADMQGLAGPGRNLVFAGQALDFDSKSRTFYPDWVINRQNELAVCNSVTNDFDPRSSNWTLISHSFTPLCLIEMLDERAKATVNTRKEALIRGYLRGPKTYELIGRPISKPDLIFCNSCETVHVEQYRAADDVWDMARTRVPGDTLFTFVQPKLCLACFTRLVPRQLSFHDFPQEFPQNSAMYFAQNLSLS